MQMKKPKDLFSRRKKGAIEISLTELMGAVLAVIIILVIAYVGFRLAGILFIDKDYDSTITSFEVLGERIDSLIEDENYANTNLIYFLDSDYILVGYNYEDTVEMESCEKGLIFKDRESLEGTKRRLGGMCDKGCLCIYKDTTLKDFDDDYGGPSMALKCKTFDKNVVFLAPTEQDIVCSSETGWHPDYYLSDKNYKFLILEGFNTKELYLDKYEDEEGNVFIFMAEYKDDSGDSVYKRREFVEGEYNR